MNLFVFSSIALLLYINPFFSQTFFKEALAADVMHRAADIKKEINFVLNHEADCSYMTDLLSAGKLHFVLRTMTQN